MEQKSRGFFSRLSGPHGITHYSLSRLVAWGDHLKVEHPHIDAQHEAIFGLVAEADDLWRDNADLKDLRALVEKLSNVLEAHFRYEESVLAEAGYPKLEEHKAEHAVMLGELAVIRNRLAAKGDGPAYPESGWIVRTFMLGVTVGHVANSDLDYFVHVRGNKKAGVAPK
jgi:hemerythrin-like metal-binding protein